MEWAKRIRERLTDIAVTDSLEVAARDVLPMIGRRVFEGGKMPDGNTIGDYSTNPIRISKKNTPKGPGGFFPGGYKQFKQSIGMPGTVNLRLFGVLMRDFYTMRPVAQGQAISLRLKSPENVEKKNIAVNRYGDPFGFSEQERQVAQQVFAFELKKRLFNA